jgi:DNA-binding CsgD family transcriptional regulator
MLRGTITDEQFEFLFEAFLKGMRDHRQLEAVRRMRLSLEEALAELPNSLPPCFREIEGKDSRKKVDLTQNESTVVLKLAAGKRPRVMGPELSMSREQVRAHLHRVYKKVGVKSADALLEMINQNSVFFSVAQSQKRGKQRQ